MSYCTVLMRNEIETGSLRTNETIFTYHTALIVSAEWTSRIIRFYTAMPIMLQGAPAQWWVRTVRDRCALEQQSPLPSERRGL